MKIFHIMTMALILAVSSPARATEAQATRLVRKINTYFLAKNVPAIINLIPPIGVYDRGYLISKNEAARLLKNSDSDIYKRHFVNKDSFREFLLSGPSPRIELDPTGHGFLVELHKGPGVKPFLMYIGYAYGTYHLAEMPYEEGRKHGP